MSVSVFIVDLCVRTAQKVSASLICWTLQVQSLLAVTNCAGHVL